MTITPSVVEAARVAAVVVIATGETKEVTAARRNGGATVVVNCHCSSGSLQR